MRKLRVGMMGFGRVGRQIYRLALKDERFDVVAISDIGRPEILHHLLTRTDHDMGVGLNGNYLECGNVRTRLMPADHPTEIPWDVFGVDVVIEATGRFHRADDLRPHLHNGAPRVVLSALPQDDIDRVVLVGVNDTEARAAAPSHTVRVAVARKGQMRRRITPPAFPSSACQRLVTKDGAMSSTMAVGRFSIAVRSPRQTVGSPSPITPLTVPASTKVPATAAMVAGSQVKGCAVAGPRPARPESRAAVPRSGGSRSA